MAEDWVNDLTEFGSETVSQACEGWRRAHDKRPTIASIRALCQETRSMRVQIGGDKTERQLGMTRDQYARSVGFDSWLQRADWMKEAEKRYELAEQWRNSPEGRAILDELMTGKPRKPPSLPPVYDPEAMRAARVALGLEPQNQRVEDKGGTAKAKSEPKNVVGGQDNLAKLGLEPDEKQRQEPANGKPGTEARQNRHPKIIGQDDLAKRLGDEEPAVDPGLF